jgi:hypothetical protein
MTLNADYRELHICIFRHLDGKEHDQLPDLSRFNLSKEALDAEMDHLGQKQYVGRLPDGLYWLMSNGKRALDHYEKYCNQPPDPDSVTFR